MNVKLCTLRIWDCVINDNKHGYSKTSSSTAQVRNDKDQEDEDLLTD